MLIVLFASSPSTSTSRFSRINEQNFTLLNDDKHAQYAVYNENPPRIVAVLRVDVYLHVCVFCCKTKKRLENHDKQSSLFDHSREDGNDREMEGGRERERKKKTWVRVTRQKEKSHLSDYLDTHIQSTKNVVLAEEHYQV
jgi:hypothetical protein